MTEHQGGKGNFANDPERASKAGKKGGQSSNSHLKNQERSTQQRKDSEQNAKHK